MNKRGDSNLDPVITAILTLLIVVVLIFFVAQIPAAGNVLKEKVNDVVKIFKDVFKGGVSKEKKEADEQAKIVFNLIVDSFTKCIEAESDNCKCDFNIPELNEDYKVAMTNIRNKNFDLYLYDKDKQELVKTERPGLIKFTTSEPVKSDESALWPTLEEYRKHFRYKCDDYDGRNSIDLAEDNLYLHFKGKDFFLEDGNENVVGHFVEGLPRIYKNDKFLCFVTDEKLRSPPLLHVVGELRGGDFYSGLESCS